MQNENLPAEKIDHLVVADAAIADILRDIRGRSGIGDEWDNIDVDTRNGIIRGWRVLIVDAINKYGRPSPEPRVALLEDILQNIAECISGHDGIVFDDIQAHIDRSRKPHETGDCAVCKGTGSIYTGTKHLGMSEQIGCDECDGTGKQLNTTG